MNASADRNARDRLIEKHLSVARRIARRMSRNADPSLREDIEASAMVGLVEAAERYDASRAEPFIAFAQPRIRGAVLDGMRRDDMLPRRVRSLAKRARRLSERLTQEFGRDPEPDEVAQRLGMSVDQYRGLATDGLKLVEMNAEAEAKMTLEETISSEVAQKRAIERIREVLPRLERRDAEILSLYYVEELTLGEISRIYGVSEPRISQLRKRALERLRVLL